ncbi:MAG: zinc-dependent peptidase [Thiolinea sp.]
MVTEVFFEQPAELQAEHPALFEQLHQYTGSIPLDWAA